MSFSLRIRIIIIIAVTVMLQPDAFAAERVIKLATLNWCPYVCKVHKNHGFTTEIVSRAFNKAGYAVQIDFMPWSRVLAEVRSGEYDAMYPAYDSEERARIYAFSESIAEGPLVFYKRVGENIQFKSLSELKPYTIGVVRGYVNTREFDEADFLIKKPVNSDKQNLFKLLAGRIDLAVIDKFTAQQIINTSIPEAVGKLDYIEPPLQVKSLHVGFSKEIKDYPQLLKKFNRALKEMLKQGVVENLMEKQGIKTYQREKKGKIVKP